MMRGRLIFPFHAEICRLDTAAMASASSGGFDADFKEPLPGQERIEHPPVRVPCQVESQTFEDVRLGPSGDSPRSDMILVFHFRDLEQLGLVEPSSGQALIRPNDRLSALYDCDGAPVQAIRTPPGLYVREALPRGFGLNRRRPRRNLLLVSLEARPLAPRGG